MQDQLQQIRHEKEERKMIIKQVRTNETNKNRVHNPNFVMVTPRESEPNVYGDYGDEYGNEYGN
jgi:hypothetical protein